MFFYLFIFFIFGMSGVQDFGDASTAEPMRIICKRPRLVSKSASITVGRIVTSIKLGAVVGRSWIWTRRPAHTLCAA